MLGLKLYGIPRRVKVMLWPFVDHVPWWEAFCGLVESAKLDPNSMGPRKRRIAFETHDSSVNIFHMRGSCAPRIASIRR